MLRKTFGLINVLAILSILSGSTIIQTAAQIERNPDRPASPRQPYPGHANPAQPAGFPNRLTNVRPEPAGSGDGLTSIQVAPQATGGPDYFGYTWDNTVSPSWIDATVGMDTGLSGESWDQATGPISLPFSFRFYDDIYNQIWIAASGYLAFKESWYWPDQQDPLPSREAPNAVIAPFWTVLYLQNSGGNGKVYYHTGGTAPNRFFVVEWHNVAAFIPGDPSGGDESYRFEVVLYESGDILFQYDSMVYNDWRYYASIGIEDPAGEGLGYMDWDTYWDRLPSSGSAVRFFRPAPAARVKLSPEYTGEFTHGGKTQEFELTLRNTGELGADTYDLTYTSAWPLALSFLDGSALTDTDSDSLVDTGLLTQGASIVIIAEIQSPVTANVGDENTAVITARSSLDAAKADSANLMLTVPAPFAQVYSDEADGILNLYLVKPDDQDLKRIPDSYAGGYDLAVAETPGFIYAWSRYLWTGTTSVSNIEYTLHNDAGEITRSASLLTNNIGAEMNTYDYEPVVAVAPNGNIGVAWYRFRYDSNNDKYNYNIWYAVLDSAGNILSGPSNLTNNNVWGDWNDYDIPEHYNPRIAATTDNHFALAWERYSYETNGSLVDIFNAVVDSNGTLLKPASKYTNGIAGDSNVYYDMPALAPLDSGRVLLVYEGPDCITYVILDSLGNTFQGETPLSWCGNSVDATQLSNGRSIIAWTGGDVGYAILDTNYDVSYSYVGLENPVDDEDDKLISVAADKNAQAVLTWTDDSYENRRYLYYALIDSSGSVINHPAIFRSAELSAWDEYYLEIGYSGYGNTSYSIPPTAPGVDTYIDSPSLSSSAPGGVATIPVSFGNIGSSTASSVTITATLDISLTYQTDSAGIPPLVDGNTLTWQLESDLNFLGNGQFTLRVSAPDSPYGTRFPVTLQITSPESEANPSNNIVEVDVFVARQVFLPVISNR